MGCITGLIAKVFLIAFNVAVAITAISTVSTASIVSNSLNDYSPYVPDQAVQIVTGLQSVAGITIAVCGLGALVACCCQNKLFLYTFVLLGAALVVTILTFSIMGQTDMDDYSADVKAAMEKDLKNYTFPPNPYSDFDKSRDKIYARNQCCGVTNSSDWKNATSNTNHNQYPYGCCGYTNNTVKCAEKSVFQIGCYTQFQNDVNDMATATASLGIFFGVFLLALISSTCVCVKCTDAMPI